MGNWDHCPRYVSEQAAEKRVAQLQRVGLWPGIVRPKPGEDQVWRLTYDPPDIALLDSHGYVGSNS